MLDFVSEFRSLRGDIVFRSLFGNCFLTKSALGLRLQPAASRLRRKSRTRSILSHRLQRYWMMSLPSASGALLSSFIVSLHTMQFKRPMSGLLSSFA